MRKQDIEITISPSGQVSFTVKGVKGDACLAETKFLEDALGGQILEREKTTEYYQEREAGYVSGYAGGSDDD